MKLLRKIVAALYRRLCADGEFRPINKMSRREQRAEIHMLAQGLGLVSRNSRSKYERAIATFFNGKQTSSLLTDSEHAQFLTILRAWKRARAIAEEDNGYVSTAQAVMRRRRIA